MIFKVLTIIVFLSSCSQLHVEQDPQSPQIVEQKEAESITNNSSGEELAANAPNKYLTDYGLPYSCAQTLQVPLQAEPMWISPHTIWQRIRIGLSLNYDIDNTRLDAEFNWYRKHQNYMARVSERSQRYIYYIVEQLEEAHLPLELALLPIVESAYDPFAYSHGRASGMWQFIPSTGRHFNLEQNWWYDGRRDIVASTHGAIKYLQSLSKRYNGDWLLALAAYNSGQGTVGRAIRKNKKLGKPVDFWSLDLPKETRSYVPKLLALAKLVDNPRRYGVSLFPIDNAPYFTIVDTQSQIDLAQAALMAGVEIDEIYRLNPGFNRWATTPSGPHRLLIPLDREEQFNRALQDYPIEDRLIWQRYTIKNGDVLAVLARRFKTDVKTIKEINGLKNSRIRAGKSLMIPIASKNKDYYTYSADQRLASIHKKRTGGKNTRQVFHRVKSGESLWTIARRYDVSVAKLAHWNSLGHKETLKINKKLSVWVPNETPTKTLAGQREKITKKVGYKVRSGDSLARIADRFNLGIGDITTWNSISRDKYLQPGQNLTLYIDIMNAVN